ncbi:golgin A5 isoform X2 [Choristoneura fumiferana]|uniref:golgin A5 isoform X2 n=1 Tax=Choristoneura fumiferana TaxID=7141 RepID=UPI003D15CBFE
MSKSTAVSVTRHKLVPMAWFADLAGKAESLLNNLDEQTGAALRNHNGAKKKETASDFPIRRSPRTTKKLPGVTETKSNNIRPTLRLSPNSRQSRSQTKESTQNPKETKKTIRTPRKQFYDIDHCPDTLVGDVKNVGYDKFGLKHRRLSLPCDLEVIRQDSFTFRMQNLEVENAMLKNELNVMNREVTELLDRLRRTEDEFKKKTFKLEDADVQIRRLQIDNETYTAQFEMLKNKINDLTTVEIVKVRELNKGLELEVNLLRERNKELEDLVRQLNDKTTEQEAIKTKLENELRHAQTTINELEGNLEKATAECGRLEKDWDAYKLRVKSMLFTKDKEIKALQDGMNLTEDTKLLIEQIEALKEEREELAEAVQRARSESSDTRRHVEQLEARHSAAERVVTALRDALRDERSAKTKAEQHSAARAKELKSLQMETNHTIASLHTALRDKENEITRLRETSVRSPDSSALNVADYDDMQEAIDNEKIHYLTQTLVQKQGKIDTLLADNNMMKIQMEKLESKYKQELAALRNQSAQGHSVVQLQDDGRSRRLRVPGSTLAAVSRRIGVVLTRYPVFRMFMLFYMLGLHFWVLTVLFTSTPENYATRPKTIPKEA